MTKKISIGAALTMALIAMTITFSVTMVVAMQIFDQTVNNMLQQETANEKLDEINRYIRGNYYPDIDENRLGDDTAKGFIAGLSDNRNTYYTADEYQRYMDINAGNVVGVGIEVTRNTAGYYQVIKVYENAPAYTEGIQPHSQIVTIDGIDVKTITNINTFKDRLYGDLGSELVLRCTVGLTSEEKDYTITRIRFIPPTIETRLTNDGYGYVRIYSFGSDTPTEFENGVKDLIEQGAKGLLIDLRSNSGTNYAPVYTILDLICPQGKVQGEFKGGIVKTITTFGSDTLSNLPPIVSLVNEKTSGAAELMALAIRNIGGDYISGTKTAGNGAIVSDPYPLSDGSAISIITAKVILTVEETSQSYEGIGLTPAVEVSSENITDSMLYNPSFEIDLQLSRSLELLRTHSAGHTPIIVESIPAESENDFSEDGSGSDSSVSTAA